MRSQEEAKSAGKIVIQLEFAPVWSFAARWPSEAGINGCFMRVQGWLVDAAGHVRVCTMGCERGDANLAPLAEIGE